RLFGVFAARPDVDFQILTERPNRLAPFADPLAGTELGRWPPNVWIGTSIEDRERADRRIPILLGVTAAVRFPSCEPLPGPLDLSSWLRCLQWVVIGGESGPRRGPMTIVWLTSIADRCRQSAVPCFVKQNV